MRFTVCCSMKQIDTANRIKETLENASSDVFCCVPTESEENQSMVYHFNNYLTHMDTSDLVFILKKPDGTIGESVAYELAYCIHNDIRHLIIDPVYPIVCL